MSAEFFLDVSPEQRLSAGDVVHAHELLDRSQILLRVDQLVSDYLKPDFTHELTNEAPDNAVTSLFEELTAAGDLSVLRFEGDQQAVHDATVQRLINGFHEPAPQWDAKRRKVEIAGELQVGILGNYIMEGRLPSDSLIIDVSDFPDDADSLQQAHDAGYRAGNKKGMLRCFYFEQQADGSWVRVLEQLSRSNSLNGSTRAWFNKNARAVPLNSTGALSEQLVISRQRLPDGIVSLAAELDEASDQKLLFGEPKQEAMRNNRPSYEAVRGISLERRKQLNFLTSELALYETELTKMLHAGSINYKQKLSYFHDKQNEIVDRVLLLDNNYAADARGELSAKYYLKAVFARERGDFAGFMQAIDDARHARDPLSGGACGGAGGMQNEQQMRELYDKSLEDKKNWEWKMGICVVRTCNSRRTNALVLVGPCSICKSCQSVFEGGGDPTRSGSTEIIEQAEPPTDLYTVLMGNIAIKNIQVGRT